MQTVFISDLHLDQQRPEIIRLFLDFLHSLTVPVDAHDLTKTDALYILGDLFEAWIGDDASLSAYQKIIQALHTTAAQIPVFFIHGNRDFLIAQQFAKATGITLLKDPCVVDLYGEKVLLSHGDIFCSDDTEYQKFRQMTRDSAWQQMFLAKPVEERLAIAQSLRQESTHQKQLKSSEIMDVNIATVEDYMHQFQVKKLIHGHTHRPAHHQENGYERIVLGEWYEQGSYLRSTSDGDLQNITLK